MPQELLFIVGPTASGKTGLAIREARERGAIILSCDSLCVYRGMDIGTAKPTMEEREGIEHFGIDLVDPHEPYSVARYIEYRDRLLERARSDQRPVIVAGGSGFYLKSFFFPVVDSVEVPAEVLKKAEAVRRDAGLEGLVTLLREINPPEETFHGLDLRNMRRVEKALIRCMATGDSYSHLRQAFEALPEPLAGWTKTVWLIERPMQELQERNRSRVKLMLDSGLVEEVRELRGRGFEQNPSACGAIGYREVLQFLDGHFDREELAEQIFVHTNQLMRKQRTWFRSQIPVHRTIAGA